MSRRPRSDSISSMLGAMKSAALPPLEPPPQCALRDGDRPFWDDIVASRAREEWTPNDLAMAAQLARCRADIEREQAALDAESSIIENARGTMVMNPRQSVLDLLLRQQLALVRTLRMGGAAAGTARDEAGALKTETQAKRIRKSLAEEEDELLAL